MTSSPKTLFHSAATLCSIAPFAGFLLYVVFMLISQRAIKDDGFAHLARAIALLGGLTLAVGAVLGLFALVGIRRLGPAGILQKVLLGWLGSVALLMATFVSVHKTLEECRYHHSHHYSR